MGQLSKVDVCTSSTTRVRYLRICIEVPLEKLLKSYILIGHHKKMLLYEGLNLLCTRCGRFGHANFSCHSTQQQSPTQPTSNSSTSTQNDSTQETECKTVSFPKKSLQCHNNNRNTVNNRAAQVVAKPGQQMTTSKSTISTGPSEAHQPSKNTSVINLLSNKFKGLTE